jgi:hypothetical protein
MGVGERFCDFEQNLIKIWIFLKYRSLGEGEEEKLLREEIWNSLENDSWHLHLKFPWNFDKINSLISELNKRSGKDIIKILSDYKAERVENGGCYGLVNKNGQVVLTCELPPYN